jgi:hypothetical protein
MTTRVYEPCYWSAATAYGNQRRLDVTSNGVLWAAWTNNVGSGLSRYLNFNYSTDEGATWSSIIGGPDVGSAGAGYEANASMFIDLDDYMHIVYKNSNDYQLYYRRGTPNAARTSYTWSAAYNLTAQNSTNLIDTYRLPDLVAHRVGNGWAVHIVASCGGAANYLYAVYIGLSIDAGGNITPLNPKTPVTFSGSNNFGYIGGDYGALTNSTFPSIDFYHTGDGKTVKDGTPHLFIAWSAGTTGSGKGIRYRMARFENNNWTWEPEQAITEGHYIVNPDRWINCMYTGERIMLAGTLHPGGTTDDMFVYERDLANTSTKTHAAETGGGYNRLYKGSCGYDQKGNIYFFGERYTGSFFTDMFVQKFDLAAQRIGSRQIIELGSFHRYVNVKRSNSEKIHALYTSGYAANSAFAVRCYTGDVSPWNFSGTVETSSNSGVILAEPLSYSEEVLADSPVAYWKLDEESGSFINSAGGQNGTEYGSGANMPTRRISGPAGPGVGFGGYTYTNAIAIPHDSALNVITGLTIEAWVYTGELTTQSGHIFEKTSGGSVNSQYSLFLQNNGNTMFRTVSGSAHDFAVTTPTRIKNEWFHIAATWDGSVKRIYYNGSLLGTSGSVTSITTGTGPSSIGAYTTGGVPASFWLNGSISHVAVYDYALSQAQIASHVNAGRYPGLVQNRQYEWQVRTRTDGIWGPWSDSQTFRLEGIDAVESDEMKDADGYIRQGGVWVPAYVGKRVSGTWR